ncbi:TlpA family protein disulfide reductase [Litorilituus sediminis]|nr:TlpA disulfide reductase family protein [Litorilituus sediminis]
MNTNAIVSGLIKRSEFFNPIAEGKAVLRSLLIQAIIFFLAFQLVSYFRETSMLATDTHIVEQYNADFNAVTTLDNNTVSLFAQGKTTVLYFFAPWCQVCHASIRNLQALHEDNKAIKVVAIALDYIDDDEVAKFTSKHQLTFPVALGNEGIKKAFSITGYPSYYVLNKQNVITAKSMGYSSELGLYLRSLIL